MAGKPARQRPAGRQLPALQPKVESIRIGNPEPPDSDTPEVPGT